MKKDDTERNPSDYIDISPLSVSAPYSLYRWGGFTTPSTVGIKSLALLKDGAMLKVSFNIILHINVGLAAVWLVDILSRL